MYDVHELIERQKTIKKLVKDGVSLVDIGKMYGFSFQMVQNILRTEYKVKHIKKPKKLNKAKK